MLLLKAFFPPGFLSKLFVWVDNMFRMCDFGVFGAIERC